IFNSPTTSDSYPLSLPTLFRSLIKLSQKRESLESIPVFAQNMAVRVLAELGDVRRFSNLNKISVFIGIDRERYQSGEMNSKFKRSEEHTSELQSRFDLVCRLLL